MNGSRARRRKVGKKLSDRRTRLEEDKLDFGKRLSCASRLFSNFLREVLNSVAKSTAGVSGESP